MLGRLRCVCVSAASCSACSFSLVFCGSDVSLLHPCSIGELLLWAFAYAAAMILIVSLSAVLISGLFISGCGSHVLFCGAFVLMLFVAVVSGCVKRAIMGI